MIGIFIVTNIQSIIFLSKIYWKIDITFSVICLIMKNYSSIFFLFVYFGLV